MRLLLPSLFVRVAPIPPDVEQAVTTTNRHRDIFTTRKDSETAMRIFLGQRQDSAFNVGFVVPLAGIPDIFINDLDSVLPRFQQHTAADPHTPTI